MKRKLFSFLGIKIGLAIVLVEVATLFILGLVYTHRFSAQVDRQERENLRKPGVLLAQGALRPEAVGYRNIMEGLVGVGVEDAMVVSSSGNIFHSLKPEWIGRNFSDLPGAKTNWLATAQTEPMLESVVEGHNSFRLYLGPVKAAPDRAPFLFCYVKLRTTEAEREKAVIARRFLIGSVAGIIATSLAIMLCFRLLMSARLQRIVEAVKQISAGNYSARISSLDSSDEIGLLKEGFNDMAAKLQHNISSLETSVASLKTAEAARRENEENFRRVFEAAPVPLIMTRMNGLIVMMNRAGGELLEVQSAEMTDQPADQFYLDPEARQKLLGVVRQDGRADQVELEIKSRMGKRRWVSISMFGIEYHGEPVLLASAADLTERKQAETERLAWERKLQETQKLESLGVLAGGIAHDFNNLLTGILGNASLASSDLPADAPVQEYLSQIEQSSLRAAELCKQMLAYAGKAQFSMSQLDLSELVSETTHLLRLTISKRATLQFDLAPTLPPALVDPTQIRQVIMNLVINASDALEGKDGVIVARTGMMRLDEAAIAELQHAGDLAQGDYVYVEISDSGCGMSPEVLARIFEPFFSTKFTGRGLGLAAVLGIVRGHHGTLKVKSKPGQGSAFQVLLPAVHNSLPAAPKPALRQIPWRSSGEILLVDDEESVRRVAKAMLEALGFQVTQAVNGKDGLEKFRARPKDFRIVVLDLTMPQMDGMEALTEIRRIQPFTPVLLASGFDERHTVSQMTGGEPTAFLQKPYKLNELSEKLRMALQEE